MLVLFLVLFILGVQRVVVVAVAVGVRKVLSGALRVARIALSATEDDASGGDRLAGVSRVGVPLTPLLRRTVALWRNLAKSDVLSIRSEDGRKHRRVLVVEDDGCDSVVEAVVLAGDGGCCGGVGGSDSCRMPLGGAISLSSSSLPSILMSRGAAVANENVVS